MADQSQISHVESQRRADPERSNNPTVAGSPEQNRSLRSQNLDGNAAVAGAAGLSGRGDDIDPMSLLAEDTASDTSKAAAPSSGKAGAKGTDGSPSGAAPGKDDPNTEVSATDIPGVLYSNTSKTNLNKTSNWSARLGFALGTSYQASVTLDDLILAGRDILTPSAREVGSVKVPAGAGTTDPREYDYIDTPTGSVREAGANRFALRGGAGGAGAPVTLTFANNGALNLARLARSAYELAIAKGVTVRGDTVDYHGQTFALGCTVQMGNAINAEGARAYGYVGEFDLKWIREKVSATVEAICSATAVAVGKGMSDGGSGDLVHPYHENVAYLQTQRHEVKTNADGTPVRARKVGVEPIESNTFPQPQVQAWGQGQDQKAWLGDPAALAAAAQRRLRGSWAPGSDWHGHPTYITDCPDFSGPLTDCFDACGKTSKGIADMSPILLGAIRQVGGMLQQAPMNHDLLDDPELLARLDTANRGIIAKAFDNVTLDQVKELLEGLKTPQRPPSLKGSEAPVEGDVPNTEGMVLLQDWSSRG